MKSESDSETECYHVFRPWNRYCRYCKTLVLCKGRCVKCGKYIIIDELIDYHPKKNGIIDWDVKVQSICASCIHHINSVVIRK